MMHNGTYIRATNLIGLDAIIAGRGGDYAALLAEAGIPGSVSPKYDGLISFDRYGYLLELAAARLAMPDLGLEWAQQSMPHFPQTGPLVMIANFVHRLDEWIAFAQRYWHFHTNGFEIDVHEAAEPDTIIARYRGKSIAIPGRQLAESCIANLVGMVGVIIRQPDVAPRLVRFQHDKAADSELYRTLLRCDIEFGAEHTEIVFDKALMQRPTGGHLVALKPLMTKYIGWRIKRMPIYDQRVATTVAHAISSLIGTGKCNIELVAETLNQNVKQLQRQLASEDTSFSDVFEEVRQTMARRMLAETDAPVARIAGLLDYAATGPFTMAFNRWTGQSPLNYRKTEQARMRGES